MSVAVATRYNTSWHRLGEVFQAGRVGRSSSPLLSEEARHLGKDTVGDALTKASRCRHPPLFTKDHPPAASCLSPAAARTQTRSPPPPPLLARAELGPADSICMACDGGNFVPSDPEKPWVQPEETVPKMGPRAELLLRKSIFMMFCPLLIPDLETGRGGEPGVHQDLSLHPTCQ